ncbi:hypothetical protein SDJN03_01482, partial [Cucurbita argyrosperma subsp. sororia]
MVMELQQERTPSESIEDSLKLLKDEQRLAGLFLVTIICEVDDRASLTRVYYAVGAKFLDRLLRTGMFLNTLVSADFGLAAFFHVPEISGDRLGDSADTRGLIQPMRRLSVYFLLVAFLHQFFPLGNNRFNRGQDFPERDIHYAFFSGLSSLIDVSLIVYARCLILVLEKSRAEIGMVLNELAYMKYDA